jgi:hypothetical protein
MWKKAFICVALTVVRSATGLGGTPSLSESVFQRAFEQGPSFAIVKVLSVRDQEKMYYYKVEVVRTIVAGDLTKEEAGRPLELFAGASYGNALKPGSHYALFIDRDCPYWFSWAFRDDSVEIDPNNKEAVRSLANVAERIYSKTAILRFRQTRIVTAPDLPSLPDVLASLCKQFKNMMGQRAELGKRIFESDLGSKVEESGTSGHKYLPPKITCTRRQIVSLLGYPTWRNGWTYSWPCDGSSGPQQGGPPIGILSVTFDHNEIGVQVTYETQERSRWARPRMPGSILAEADGDPAGAAGRFQQALKDSDWNRALSCCSSSVQAKAKEFASPEAFFNTCVPIKELVGRTFDPHSYSSREGKTVTMGDTVELPTAATDRTRIQWRWTLRRVDSTWLVDFSAIPLDRFIEKEKIKWDMSNGGRRTPPEEFDRAIKYILSPVSSEFVIGQPMLFRIEMKNEGNTPIGFRRTSVIVNDPIRVIAPDGGELPYVDTSYQTVENADAILSGEVIVLADEYDVASQYEIIRPGRYKFQFQFHYPRERTSNVCEVEVHAGPVPDAEQIVSKLVRVLPGGWRWSRRIVTPGEFRIIGPGTALYVQLIGKPGGKENPYNVFLLILIGADPADADPWLKEELNYWGGSRWGPVYAQVNEAESLWPQCRQVISEALEIKSSN